MGIVHIVCMIMYRGEMAGDRMTKFHGHESLIDPCHVERSDTGIPAESAAIVWKQKCNVKLLPCL
jgi:hypothetical protein